MPVGRGQRGVGGRALATAAAAVMPITQRPSLRAPRSKRWKRINRSAQIIGGKSRAITPSPTSCISRSAIIAPGRPSQLRTAPLVALLRLGSSADQLARASATTTIRARRPRPTSSAARRDRNSRTGSGRRSMSDRERRMVRMRLRVVFRASGRIMPAISRSGYEAVVKACLTLKRGEPARVPAWKNPGGFPPGPVSRESRRRGSDAGTVTYCRPARHARRCRGPRVPGPR